MVRGNGRGYGAEDYVRDILALTDALGLNRVRLIGHETGGWLGGGFVLSLADTAVVGVTTIGASPQPDEACRCWLM
jgi:pimeloyl-ACP methyl ester carboxylesterase